MTPVGHGTTTDVTATANAVRSLIPFKAADSLVVTAVTEALGTLTTLVGAASPNHLKAIAALAMLRNDPAAPAATPLLDALRLSQAADGSWGGDPYTTALAVQAMASRMGSDAPTNLLSVQFADPNLRTAVNTTLGRNSLDALNRGELAQLTSLNASNMGISSLQGLEFAVNLRTIDLRGNPITSPRAGTTVTVTAPSYYSLAGKPITLTALVSAPLAIGKIEFYDRGQLLGMADATAGRSVLSITPAVGQNQFTVQYSGDVANAPSTSTSLGHFTDSGAVLHSILELLLE